MQLSFFNDRFLDDDMAGLRGITQPKRMILAAGACAIGGGLFGMYIYPKYSEFYKVYSRKRTADLEVIKRCEEGFKKLQEAENCDSLLKKALTKDVLDQLKDRRTVLGATLWDVIASGALANFVLV